MAEIFLVVTLLQTDLGPGDQLTSGQMGSYNIVTQENDFVIQPEY